MSRTSRDLIELLVASLIVVLPISALGEVPEGVRVSFYGYQSTPIGYFDDSVDSSVSLWIGGTIGPAFQGSVYYFGILSAGHRNIGYTGLADTRIDCPEFPCTSCAYTLTARFVGPGTSLIIGSVGPGDQNAQLAGTEWEGHSPPDFTHLEIVVDAHEPLMICPRYYLLPITWLDEPVSSNESTWGKVKALYGR